MKFYLLVREYEDGEVENVTGALQRHTVVRYVAKQGMHSLFDGARATPLEDRYDAFPTGYIDGESYDRIYDYVIQELDLLD